MKPHPTKYPFALTALSLEDVLPRLDNFETAVAIVDERGRVVRANGLWDRRKGLELWSAVGDDLDSACEKAAGNGSHTGFRLGEELRNILGGRTESCD